MSDPTPEGLDLAELRLHLEQDHATGTDACPDLESGDILALLDRLDAAERAVAETRLRADDYVAVAASNLRLHAENAQQRARAAQAEAERDTALAREKALRGAT